MRFDQRVIYITGGGHGIGRAIAHRLASEGGSVAVSDIDIDAARQVADEIADEGGTAVATSCDVTSTGAIDASIASIVSHFGRLDVLVTTAGGDWHEPAFEQITDDLWDQKLDVNLTGTFRCIRAALPHLIAAGPGSNVVVIGSINGNAAIGGYPYSAAKAGLEILMKNLARQYGPQGLRFNLVAPGTIRTRNWDNREADLVRLAATYPLRRVGEPEDVAAAVAFLASSDAAWITGVTLPVEGGILAGPIPRRDA